MKTRNHPVEPEELMAYLDGELPHQRAAETAAHLEHCPECQTLAAELREVSHKLMAWQVETPEGGDSADLFTAVEKEGRQPGVAAGQGILGWWKVVQSNRMLWAGGMVAVMALATVFFFSAKYSPRAPESTMAQQTIPEKLPPPPANGPEPGQTEYYYNSENALVPPTPSPENRKAAGGAADKSETSLYLYDALGKLSSKATRADSAPAPAPPSPIVTPGTVDINGNAGGFSTNGRLRQKSELTKDGALDDAEAKDQKEEAGARPAAKKVQGPMIVHEAQLSLVSRDFEHGRAAIEEILKRHGGYVGSLNVAAPPGSGRTLNATLRVPAVQLQDTLTELKKLGRVTAESQTGEEVTDQYVDLEARLSNSRNSEQRLKELLRQRTGKLKDVMEVELQIDRVRGEIESMDAERKNLGDRVDFATLTVTLIEEYKAELQVVPVSTWTRMGNAAIEGYRTMVEGVVGVVLFVFSVAPSLLLWVTLLFLPARWTWKRLKLQRAAV
jgi:hypothetical protein